MSFLLKNNPAERIFTADQALKALHISRIESETVLVICKDKKTAEDLFEDLIFFSTNSYKLEQFPSWELLPYESLSAPNYLCGQRIAILNLLQSKNKFRIITSIDAIVQKIIPQKILEGFCFEVQVGQNYPRQQLIEKFLQAGFQSSSAVEDIGDLCMRGGVIDFYPALHTNPIRLKFIGEKLSNIISFDVESQRSFAEKTFQSFKILPTRECFYPAKISQELLQNLKTIAHDLEVPPSEVEKIICAIEQKNSLPGIENIQAFIWQELSSFLTYLPKDLKIVIDQQIAVEQNLDSYWELIEERYAKARAAHELVPQTWQVFTPAKELLDQINQYPRLYFDSVSLLENPSESRSSLNLNHSQINFKIKSKAGTGQAFLGLKKQINLWRAQGYAVAFVISSQTRAERLQKILLDYEIFAAINNFCGLDWIERKVEHPVTILIGHISSGFEFPSEKIIFVAEAELFGEKAYRRKTSSKKSLRRILSSLGQLKESDHIVHIDYGIGIYRGLKHKIIENAGYDFLLLEYAEKSLLYLPVENIGKIQKFVAAEGKLPSLDKLGSTRWARTKAKVRQSVVELAGDLIKLYATRSVVQGWRFEPYGAEDDRFADGFVFEETPDQLAAIKDTLKDMASDKPMDRLICGDVGFGKTEVALRAAFKCIQHGRQVAVLVPTTILVEQHKLNFQERFRDYPVRVEAVSRFYSNKINKENLAALKDGTIDIIIGTHKLIQKNVEFKDLGLLIIDEEHRFGVKQKETLKQMRKKIDVLTLTATPIPRTLQISLLSIRDLSVINTPPHDRRSVRTYVATHSDTIIRDAIMRELQRNGQCFYLHNKVSNIDVVCAKLKEVVPEARFDFAHGQMDENEIEQKMRQFIAGEIDVLVSTTIIESGLDIPNANTIIINRADAFGLAQLYQLRGRVGRSTRQAYAYLLIPDVKKIGAEAQKRISVLQSLDDLGVGFNLAIRDLEIRGAGNLLGKDQSGSVAAVGLELYNRILKEAVQHLKGNELDLEESIDPELKLGVSAFIPEDYIPDVSERLITYQRLASANNSDEIDQLQWEISDRFGDMCVEVVNMIELMRFRALLRQFGVVRAEFGNFKLLLSFSPKAKINLDKVLKLCKNNPEVYKFSKNLSLSCTFEFANLNSPADIYHRVEGLLRGIAQTD